MRPHCFLSLFLAWLLIFLIFDYTYAATTVAAKPKVSYDIPIRFSAKEELISKFKAVSSHGRSDETNTANAVVYSSFQITVRAFYLLLVFAPVLCTSWLAYFSCWYRSIIWFKLLRFGISQGGAVRLDLLHREECFI
jgi:flagellar biosynthesis protein FliP